MYWCTMLSYKLVQGCDLVSSSNFEGGMNIFEVFYGFISHEWVDFISRITIRMHWADTADMVFCDRIFRQPFTSIML